MTLSLDDVRNKRFRMARKSGYEVLEVDEFVDEVEATFEQLFEENRNLKKQVESLKTTGSPAPTPADAKPASTEQAKPAAVVAASTPEGPTERIVVTTAKEASSAVVRLVELSAEQAERLVAEATAEAAQIREQASTSAEELTSGAHARAEQVETEARAHAERLRADAEGRAQSLDQETETRRTKMFGELEHQRDELTATVHALRSFEATYRSNLTQHLQSQIQVLASGREEPADPPAALDQPPAARPTAPAPAADGEDQGASPSAGDGAPAASPTSDTPRLDALLGDQR